MSNRDIEKRLDELEKVIKSQDDSPIWIDGKNNIIRMDVNSRRGEEITFPTTFAAARWLEKRIDDHPAAVGSYMVDNICDLYEDSEELKDTIRKIIPDPIVVPDLAPHLVDGRIVYQEKSGPCNHPTVFSADELPTCLFAHLKTTQPADINLWCLAILIKRYFGTPEFRERYQNGVLSDDDINLNFVFYIIYGWDKEEPSLNDFAQLFRQLVRLPDKQSEKESCKK
jgi:hypothetical protein